MDTIRKHIQESPQYNPMKDREQVMNEESPQFCGEMHQYRQGCNLKELYSKLFELESKVHLEVGEAKRVLRASVIHLDKLISEHKCRKIECNIF